MAASELAQEKVLDEFMQEKVAEFFASGGRIRKCPPKSVRGAGHIVDYWRGSFYPVRR